MKKIYFTDKAPSPVGPYSQSVSAMGNMFFISGQICLDANGNIPGTDIETQTRQVLLNIGNILESAGLSYSNVVKTTLFLVDINDFAKVNDIYNEFFGESKPSRSTVEVSKLPKNSLLEIDAIAVF